MLSYVPKNLQSTVATAVRTIFAQPDQKAARSQLAVVVENLRKHFPRAAQLLEDAEELIWLSRLSTGGNYTPQTRWNGSTERSAGEPEVVGIFPNREALIRLAGVVIIEQQEEWMTLPRRYFSQALMAKLNDPSPDCPELLSLSAD